MSELFNRDFDAELELGLVDIGSCVDGLTYSQAEIDNLLICAKEQAFSDGHLEGYNKGHADANSSRKSEVSSALISIDDKLRVLHQQTGAIQSRMQDQALEFTISVGKRILPTLRENFPSDVAILAIRKTLSLALGVPKLTVRISPNTRKFLDAEGIDLTNDAASVREIEIFTDGKLSDGDAVIEWENGQASYSLDDICTELIEAIETTFERRFDRKGQLP